MELCGGGSVLDLYQGALGLLYVEANTRCSPEKASLRVADLPHRPRYTLCVGVHARFSEHHPPRYQGRQLAPY